jgi:hypothetical protein
LLQQHHKLLRLKLHRLLQQRQHLRNHRAWVHLVVLFRLLQVAVVQFRRLLVAQVGRLALVVHQWVVVLLVLVLVLALAVFLQVHLVAAQ